MQVNGSQFPFVYNRMRNRGLPHFWEPDRKQANVLLGNKNYNVLSVDQPTSFHLLSPPFGLARGPEVLGV